MCVWGDCKFTLFLLSDLCPTYLAPPGLAVGFSMSPPTLDGPQDDLVIPVNGTLNVTCRYGSAAHAQTHLFVSVELI